MRRALVVVLAGVDLTLLVATAAPAERSVSDTSPVPGELRLDESTPDLGLEIDYEVKRSFQVGFVELALLGDNTLPPGGAVLELYELPPGDDGSDGVPNTKPLVEIPIGGQVGDEPSPVEVWMMGMVRLAEGEHTKQLLLHLEGEADLALDGEVTLGLRYTECYLTPVGSTRCPGSVPRIEILDVRQR